MTLSVVNVVGARPNFVKIAPVHEAMRAAGGFEPTLVHTGQHYDAGMSRVFFDELGLPEPDVNLGVGSGSHVQQTADVMRSLEPVLAERQPDLVVVVGDVNSTLGAALAAIKLDLPVAHVEAGLRSFDRTMPEEINRVLVDAVAAYCFAPSDDAVENLRREGIEDHRIHLVGNVMIDSLDRLLPAARGSNVLERLELEEGGYIAATVHRPSNVDEGADLEATARALEAVSRVLPVLLVAHPRTRDRLETSGLADRFADGGIRVIEPLGYLDFVRLMLGAAAVATDSGGVQEETTVLGIPCLTLRENTERPVTVTHGTNTVVGLAATEVESAAKRAVETPRRSQRPPLWDGRTAARIVEVLAGAAEGGGQSAP